MGLKQIKDDGSAILSRLSNFHCSEVRSFEDLCQAFHLVFQEYHTLGYTHHHEKQSRLRFSLYQLFPASHTFVAKYSQTYCGTGTIIVDSSLGLPADSLFKKDLDTWRSEGRKIAEATMLSCIPCNGKNARDISVALIHQVFWWMMHHEIDDQLIIVNPRHVEFWHTKMGYEICSEEKSYANVQGAPGFLLRQDLKKLREKTQEPAAMFKQYIIANSIPKSKDSAAFHIQTHHVVKLLLNNPHLILEASEKQRLILKNHFPDIFMLMDFDFKNHSPRLREKEREGYLAPTSQWLRKHPVEKQMIQIGIK